MNELLLPTGPVRGPFALLDLGRGRAVLACEDELVALDLGPGRVAWRRPREVREPFAAPVVVGERLVELVGEVPELVSLDPASGAEVARSRPPLEELEVDCSCGVPALVDLLPFDAVRCVLLVRGASSHVLFCDLAASSVQRRALAPWLSQSHPVVCAGALVVESEEGLTALTPSGPALWTRADGGLPRAAGDQVFLLRRVEDSTHELLDGATGRTLCSFERDWLAAAVAPGPQVVGATHEASVVRVEASSPTGAQWTTELEAPPGASDVELHVLHERLVVVHTNGDDLHPRAFASVRLDRVTGAVVWSRAAPDEERLVRPVGSSLLALGPTSSWPQRQAALRWVATPTPPRSGAG